VVDLRDSPAVLAAGLVAGAVAIAVGATLIRRIGWAFPVLVFAVIALRLPLRIGGETSNLLVPLYLVIAAGFVAGVRGGLATGAGAEPPAVVWLRRLLAATLVLYAIQSSYSDDVSNAIENAGFFLVPFAVLFCQLAAVRWDATNLRAVAITIAVVGAAAAVVGIWQYGARDLFLNKNLLESNQLKPAFRVNSVFFDPNVFGRYLALGAITVAAAVAWSRGGRLALAATGAGLLMLAGIALSYSITSVAGLLAGLGVLALLRYGLRGGLAAGAAVLLTGVVFALSGGADRSDIGPSRGIAEETSGRTSLLEGGFELIEDRPALGWGSGAFGRAFFDQIRETETTASHSEPITVAAEQGVPGTLLYLAVLVVMLWALFGGSPGAGAARAAAAAAIVALMVHSLGYAGFLTDPATWAVLAVAVGVRRGEPAAPEG
jgi:O-antigen ligase